VRGTSPRLRKKGGGNGGEPHRLQEGAAEGQKRSGVGGEKPAEVGRGPVKPKVGALPFIGVGEGHAGARMGEMAGSNGLNNIDGGQLNEGLRGGLKGRIKAGSEDLAWHLEVGGRSVQGGRRRRGEAATGRPAWGRGCS
jgi:hypothetical protein